MKILLVGSKGMQGHALTTVLSPQHNLIGFDLPALDIADLAAVKAAVFSCRPALIINAAAYTDVDGCETNVEQAFAVNAQGARNLAVVCSELDIPLVHISTDYVFDGTSSVPYKELDRPNPHSVYGKSKWQGEQFVRELCPKHYIVRTSWLFGEHGKNFVSTMLRLGRERDELGVVDDQMGSPTYTGDLAAAIRELVERHRTVGPAYGTYHVTNSGTCSWFELAREIFRQAGIGGVTVKPIKTEELGRPAPRPANSVLDNGAWLRQGFVPLRHYKEALQEYLQKIQE